MKKIAYYLSCAVFAALLILIAALVGALIVAAIV